jgi:hypothetical protein
MLASDIRIVSHSLTDSSSYWQISAKHPIPDRSPVQAAPGWLIFWRRLLSMKLNMEDKTNDTSLVDRDPFGAAILSPTKVEIQVP